jgi:hypothetical protein
MLAELRSLGVYLFPGVQNTTQITQETDQNYGEFKSLLRKHIQQLMNEMYFKYHQQLQEQQNTGVNVPSAPPSLNRSHYGLLLSGRPADEENGVMEIPPIFHHSFSKEKNLRSWAACGAVPCTRQAQYHRTVSDLPQLFIFIAFQLKSLYYSCSCARTGYLEKTASCSCARTGYLEKKLAVAVRTHVSKNK